MNILNKNLWSSYILGSIARPVNRAKSVGSSSHLLNGGFLTNSMNISALTCVVPSKCLSLHANRKAYSNTYTLFERKLGNMPIMKSLGRKSCITCGSRLLWEQLKVCYSVMASTVTNENVAKKTLTKPLLKMKTKKKIRLVEVILFLDLFTQQTLKHPDK